VDGIRLDVANEVPFWMWKEFRRVVDEVKPGALLIGEIWHNAMPWLGPTYLHSTMNYKYFREPVMKFLGLGQGDALLFDRELAPGRYIYPDQASRVMMNLVGSHDTERYISMIKGDERRLMLTALFQMTYPGIPHIYYGDEVALEGGRDPDNRRTFPWDWQTHAKSVRVHNFYKKVIGIRSRYEALRSGRFQTVLASGKTYAFLRENGDQKILVALNNADRETAVRIDLKEFDFPPTASFFDAIAGKYIVSRDGGLTVEMDPLSGSILILQSSN
jgi:glycosidase